MTMITNSSSVPLPTQVQQERALSFLPPGLREREGGENKPVTQTDLSGDGTEALHLFADSHLAAEDNRDVHIGAMLEISASKRTIQHNPHQSVAVKFRKLLFELCQGLCDRFR
jgi:hypothetical protein